MTKKGKKDSVKYFDIDYLRSFLSVLIKDNKLIEKVLKEKGKGVYYNAFDKIKTYNDSDLAKN